jgi:hypothetical protein
MIGLGTKSYRVPSMGNKMYGASKPLGRKIYGPSRVNNNKVTVSSHPETLYHNSHNSNIAYVPFGTTKPHLYEDKLKLHKDLVKKHDGNLTRLKYHNDEPAPAVRKQKLFK